jgi:hypothetical protein
MRHDSGTQRSTWRTLQGAALIAGHVVAPWRRGWRETWGLAPGELPPSLPGDELIPEPNWEYTHAIQIDAPAEQVWPWIAQIGQERGGFYSFEGLENLVGCHVRNADRPVENWQHPEVGQQVRLHPSAPPLHVEVLEPGRSLVLHGAPADVATDEGGGDGPGPDSIWSFHVIPLGPTRCRLIERGRTVMGDSVVERLSFGTLLIEPIGFVMGREMLRGIKERAERATAA